MKKNEIEKNSITYWLNLLQNLECEKNIFLNSKPLLLTLMRQRF